MKHTNIIIANICVKGDKHFIVSAKGNNTTLINKTFTH